MSESHSVDDRDQAGQSTTIRSARKLLDEQAATLPPAITVALRDARARAVAGSRVHKRKRSWIASDARALAPLALAAMLLLAVSVVWLLGPPAPGIGTQAPLADATPATPAPASAPIALLAAEEGLEFYESVEFLLWLESREG